MTAGLDRVKQAHSLTRHPLAGRPFTHGEVLPGGHVTSASAAITMPLLPRKGG